jgi:hypothetical protein
MANYAVIENGVVVNTVVWDGVTAWTKPTGSTVVIIPDGTIAGTGYSYDAASQAFTAPSSASTD